MILKIICNKIYRRSYAGLTAKKKKLIFHNHKNHGTGSETPCIGKNILHFQCKCRRDAPADAGNQQQCPCSSGTAPPLKGFYPLHHTLLIASIGSFKIAQSKTLNISDAFPLCAPTQQAHPATQLPHVFRCRS